MGRHEQEMNILELK